MLYRDDRFEQQSSNLKFVYFLSKSSTRTRSSMMHVEIGYSSSLDSMAFGYLTVPINIFSFLTRKPVILPGFSGLM